ncbi:MAG: TolC family protein [Pseudomonadota bacterium]
MKSIKTLFLAGSSTLILSACISTGNFTSIVSQTPEEWVAYESSILKNSNAKDLQNWWTGFDDKTLNELVELTLNQSPDRKIAEQRIQEARGLKRTTRSFLLPQIGASANIGEEDNGLTDDNFYDAGFDASFEIDVFGENRNALNAADSRLSALEAQYHDVSLTLISEVVSTYIDILESNKQVMIAEENLEIQQKTLELITQQRDVGETPQLDVERSQALVNTTQASITNFQRLADNAQLRLTVLTGELPQSIQIILSEGYDPLLLENIEPVLLAPADVLNVRPDVKAASLFLKERTSLRQSAFASLFPSFSVSGFFGVAETALTSSTNIWNIALGTAVSLIDFGRIEGQIDAARARENIAFETYRKTILEAIVEVETALNDYARIQEQYESLNLAFQNSKNAFQLSEQLYREGETSFIDLLDAQRTLNDSQSALVTAEASKAQAAIRIYKSLGIY